MADAGAARCSAAGASSASGSGPARRPTTRERLAAPTIPQNTTNYTGRAFCDDFALDIPSKGFNCRGNADWHRFGGDAERNEPEHPRTMNVTAGHRYPANLRRRARPARSSCRPASSASRRSSTTSSRRGHVRGANHAARLQGVAHLPVRSRVVLPTLEVFNLNNSDAIISYVTTNALAATYRRRTASCKVG